MLNSGEETNPIPPHCGSKDNDSYNSNGSNNTSKSKLKHLKNLSSQVGGHDGQKFDSNSSTLPLVIYDQGDGTVLKCLQPPPRGLRELNFYREVFTAECTDPCLLELRQFLPTFYGAEEIQMQSFLKLANLTSRFQKPCVADLKMGRVTYDQEATLEKQRSEDAKFPPAKEFGFRISGFMIQSDDKPVHYGKSFCRSLTRNDIMSKGFGHFFSPLAKHQKKEVIRQLVARLEKIESWFLRQKKFSFIASSLLIIYEGLDLMSSGKDFKQHPDKLDVETTSSAEHTLTSDSLCRLSQTESASSSFIPVSSACGGVMKCQANSILETDAESGSNVKRSFDDEDSNQKNKRRKSDISNLENGMPEHIKEVISNSEILGSYPLVTVHLIDFAHVFPASGIDHNVLFGLQKLISCLQEMK